MLPECFIELGRYEKLWTSISFKELADSICGKITSYCVYI